MTVALLEADDVSFSATIRPSSAGYTIFTFSKYVEKASVSVIPEI